MSKRKAYKPLWAVAALAAIAGASGAEAATEVQSVERVETAPTTLVAQAAPVDESSLIRDMNRVDALGANKRTTAQVTSVSELSDVKPTDWAFTALQSLVERYGCIAGYPDKTYRGRQALTRYEFAAGLNACLDKINEIISAGLADKVSKEDLAALQKLQEEFAAELAALRGRVDALEAKTAQLEAQQFSTTTKLNAIAIFAPSFLSGGETDSNMTFSGRVRLNFDTSFTGKDRLRTRLQAGNVTEYGDFTRMARFGFETNTENTFELDKLFYRFPVNDNITAFVGTRGLDWDEVFNTVNPYLESGDNGALSRFGRYDPLIFRAPQGAGASLRFKFSDQIGLNVAYLASGDRAGDPIPENQGGLFGGPTAAGAQLVFTPSKSFTVALAYLRSFEPGTAVDLAGGTSGGDARRPFGRLDTSADRYGLQLNWKAAKNFSLGGAVSFANAQQESGGATNSADIFTWNVNLAFPDLGGEGNLLGFIFGQPPKVTSNTIAGHVDGSTAYLVEGLYRFRVSKNISITPGVYVIFNPDHNDTNETIWVGTIRTTFSF
jgi:hypothetical protein